MTAKQLRMAIAAEAMTLEELSEESGVAPATISRIRTEAVEARTSTMRRLRTIFTRRGYKFSNTNGHVCVCAPTDEIE